MNPLFILNICRLCLHLVCTGLSVWSAFARPVWWIDLPIVLGQGWLLGWVVRDLVFTL